MRHAANALRSLSLIALLSSAGCAALTPAAPSPLAAPGAAPAAAPAHAPAAGGHAMPGGAHVMPDGTAMPDGTPMAADPAAAPGHDAGGHGATPSGVAADDPPTSYRLEVVPILRKHCASCHTAGGGGAKALMMFDAQGEPQLEEIRAQIGRMLLEIQSGRMPKGKPDSLTQAEFDALDTWGAAETPDN